MSCCKPKASGAPQCCKPSSDATVTDSVKRHYGQELRSREELKTSVNCQIDTSLPLHIKQAMGEVHDEVTIKYYGCGPVIPEAVEGCSVLDLGSGSGRDCFAISKLVGQSGRVVGIDMTDEQLAVAWKYVDYHMEKFGYSQPNVEFVKGYIERLGEAQLKDNTFDIIISNCVINLSVDKISVLKEAYRVLKEGGELYFSDMYTDTYLPEEVLKDRLLWDECVSGSLHWEELYKVAKEVGFSQPRLVTAKIVNVDNFRKVLGDKAMFVSVTYRLFKLPASPQSTSLVTYKGGILGNPDELKFDHAFTFKKNTAVAVDSELATILSSSRFQQFFTVSPAPAETATGPSPKVDPFQHTDKDGSLPVCCK